MLLAFQNRPDPGSRSSPHPQTQKNPEAPFLLPLKPVAQVPFLLLLLLPFLLLFLSFSPVLFFCGSQPFWGKVYRTIPTNSRHMRNDDEKFHTHMLFEGHFISTFCHISRIAKLTNFLAHLALPQDVGWEPLLHTVIRRFQSQTYGNHKSFYSLKIQSERRK